MQLLPAILSADPSDIQEKCATAAHVTNTVQIDICDGIYVPGITYPFVHSESSVELPDTLSIELDCMFWSPEDYSHLFASLQPAAIVFHIETILDQEAFRSLLEHLPDSAVSFSCRNTTDLADLYSWIDSTDRCDRVQVMGISDIGQQGQPFDMSCLDRILAIKKRYPDNIVTVDGAMNANTIPQVIAAGADRCVVGSALWNSVDYAQTFTALSTL